MGNSSVVAPEAEEDEVTNPAGAHIRKPIPAIARGCDGGKKK
jgi:hypothetical protein